MAFNSSQNIQSLIMEQDGFGKLGFYSLGVQAVFQGLGSLLSAALVHKLGSLKTSMVIGATFNSLWVLQSMIPAMREKEKERGVDVDSIWYYSETFYFVTNLIISAVSGFFGCLRWVAEGKYISECATEETKGFYFSYFWAFYMQSQIFGNLSAALILGEMDQVSYFGIMAAVAFLASFSFAFLKNP